MGRKRMSIRKACTMTGISRQRISRLANEGVIDARTLGHTTLVDPQEIFAWIETLPRRAAGGDARRRAAEAADRDARRLKRS